MKRAAFLTIESLEGFFTYDDLVHGPLGELGWQVDNVAWRASSVDWNDYDLVVVRSPWDYQDDPTAFMNVLQAIEASTARLENPLSVARWNLDKRYLAELEAAGVAIVPTAWRAAGAPVDLETLRARVGGGEVVIKPTVSANADGTFRVAANTALATVPGLEDTFRDRGCMVQPFLPDVVTRGEVSLFHFAGELSHAILKTPKQGDFRVQEEHGGTLLRIEPDEAQRAAAEQALAAAPGPLLYARTDLIWHEGDWLLMELELIEPSLYFNLDPDSPARFARCIDRWMRRYA